MNLCPWCETKIAMSKAFCSRSHKTLYFEMCSFSIPNGFIKRLVVRIDNHKERMQELEKFAKYHNLNNEAVSRKFNEMVVEIYGEKKIPRVVI